MSTPETSPKITQTVETEALQPSLLDKILEAGSLSKAPDRGVELVDSFVAKVKAGFEIDRDTTTTINAMIADIDARLSRQLDEVMHHPDFQKLEASWRGLRYLLDQSETGPLLKIRMMNASKTDLLKDYRRAAEKDQAALFKQIYEYGYGTYGGTPFGALVGDYEFSNHPEDVELLEALAGTAAAAHCPFLSAANPKLLNLDSYTTLDSPRALSSAFETTEYTKWRSFRESEDARYVGLALPHMLLRLPYGKASRAVEEFDYEEGVDGTEHSRYLWGNAAYALGSKLTQAFAKYEFCTAIRGPENGGMVMDLPVHTFRTWEGDTVMKCPLEVQITDRREKELADLGFAPLVHCKGTDYAAFFSVQSCQKPKSFKGTDADSANKNARLSAELPYIFAISRFAHYMKVMLRNKIGSAMSAVEVQNHLTDWITSYVLDMDEASAEAKAEKPLRAAQVEVHEDPALPGVFQVTMFLKPHLQLNELNVSLRLVADLPKRQ
jgi:type VI secretion system protein ImpC